MMQYLSRQLRFGWLHFGSIVCLVLCSPLFALAQEAEEAEAEPSWSMGYILTFLLIVVGVGAVGFGSNRIIQESRLKQQAENAERSKAG
ncbi:MAG: hypothetical protein COA78_09490 [Blastopirellula sp.]|nr:MAG: hypothetical protein COA78_09490 [Blastopirellula sp.]